MSKIIVVAAYMQSGKDTVADYLVKNYMYQKVQLAMPIYAALCAMYVTSYYNLGITLTPDYIERNKGEYINSTQTTWRKALQTLGTEWGRTYIGNDVWVNLVKEKIKHNALSGYPSVVSDCRFINEWHQINAMFGTETSLWYIHSNRAIPQKQHGSEQEIEHLAGMTDVHLTNSGTFEELYTQIDDEITR